MGLLDYIALYLVMEIILGQDSNNRNIKMDSDCLSKDKRQVVVKFKQIIKQVHIGHRLSSQFYSLPRKCIMFKCFIERAIS